MTADFIRGNSPNVADIFAAARRMLTLGALAMALMELRGFRAEDLVIFHLGGKLGSEL